jgi:hypothetical protein
LEQLVAAAAGEQGISRERVSFTRRELREQLAWGDTQLKVHLARLVSLELVHVHRGANGVFLYQLAWDSGSAVDGALLPGVIDPDQPNQPVVDASEDVYDRDRSGSGDDWSGAGRPSVGAWSGAGRSAENGAVPSAGGQSVVAEVAAPADHGSGGLSFLAAEQVIAEPELALRRAG